MLFPIGDDNPRRTRPIVTLLLIAAMVGIWIFVQQAGTGMAMARSVCELGMIPGELTGRATGALVPIGDRYGCVVGDDPAWHTLVTSMFVHGGWFHLLGNVWFLWLFGDNVEDALGHVTSGAFYLTCGVAAAMTQLWVDPASPVPMIGASGAISGVMGAYVVLFPRVQVRVVALLVFFVTFLRVPALFALGYWFVLQLLGGIPQLVGSSTAGVAFWAHVGGFATGVVLAFTARATERVRRRLPPGAATAAP